MANKREPYVEGHRIDSSVSTTVSDSRVNVYVGIEADTGTYDLTYQQTPKVFVQEYSTKAKPDTNDASTLLHAGKLVENFGIYVKRVNKDPILPGIVSTSKYGEVGYFDTNYNLLKNITEFKITPRATSVDKQKLAIVIDNVLYINKNVAEADLDAIFEEAPTFYESNGAHDRLMSSLLVGSTVFSGSEDPIVVPATEAEGADTVVRFYAVNVGAKYSVEDFLSAVASYAKNYRSNYDLSEFLSYDADSLLASIDISAWDEPSKVYPIQACVTLVNASKLSKAMTKLEFTEGGERQLLTNTRYYANTSSSEIKYLDIGGFRYYPKIGTDTHNYADTTVTPKPSKFGYMSDDFSEDTCSVSDGILSSIDTMLTESDTVKPDSVYCSTDQIFSIQVTKDNIQGLTLLPSAYVQLQEAGDVYLVKSGFYGDGFKTSLVKLQILCQPSTGVFKWVDFDGNTQVSNFYIDNEGYAFIKITFDGQINDVSDTKAGFCLVYGTFNQSGTPDSSITTGVLLFGKNVSRDDITLFEKVTTGESQVVSPDVKNITSRTTDLGMICSLPWVRFGSSSSYTFGKVVAEPGADILASGSDTAIMVNDEGTGVAVSGVEGAGASVIHKLYMYFMNNRNITSGITGYDEQCWKKYSTVMQRNYTFDPQSKISEGLPGYHAILVGQTTKGETVSGGTIYYNGIMDNPGEHPDISDSNFGSDYELVQISTIALTATEFIDLLEDALRNNYTYISKLSDGSYVVGEPIEEPYTPVTGGLKVIDYMPVNQEENFANARYAIIQRFTSAAKLFSIDLSFDKVDKEIIKFVNSYNGTEYTDKISFNVSKIDGYGTNISYKSYNLFDGRSFFIKELNEEAPVIEMSVASFGNDIKPKKATPQDYVNALDDLVTDEFKPSFLWDAGLCQTNYTNAMTSLAETTYSMVPISVPKTAESAADVKAWKSAFNVDNPAQYILDGWHYNTVFGDISFECCPTYYYLVGKLSNANSITKEFQPMFYKTRGIVSAGVPVRNIPLTKKEREDLLDVRVNSIVRNKANSISYINQNFTNQQVESDFSEEQNVCISNEVCRSADNYADNNIISKNNTPNLRAQVTSELTNILRARILDSRGDDTAKSFYVECNDVNNPKAIIDARKLVIDIYVTYNKSINAVLVYSRTKSLDQG